jgi:hypothetical protein
MHLRPQTCRQTPLTVLEVAKWFEESAAEGVVRRHGFRKPPARRSSNIGRNKIAH